MQIEVRKFIARYDNDSGAPAADVELIARLVTPGHRMVIGTMDAHHEVPASANNIPAAVAAFNSATGQAVDEIVAWALKTGVAPASDSDTGTPVTPVHRRRHH